MFQRNAKMKTLENKYSSKGLKTIYISVDENTESWKKAADSLTENSFIVSNSANLLLKERFYINFIPKYIIFDKSGKIAYLNAPKPEGMEEILDALLKN
jgi:hypothetical protein